MKLLLTSAGLTNQAITRAFKQLAGREPDHLRVGFIPTAANLDHDQSWVMAERQSIVDLGAEVVDIDISRMRLAQTLESIDSTDVLWWNGGNTYYAQFWLHQSGLTGHLAELLKEKLYVGMSAGSMLVGANIGLTEDYFPTEMPQFRQQLPEESVVMDGLGFLPFDILPHYCSQYPQFADNLTPEIVAMKARQSGRPILALSDGRALLVTADTWRLVGEGPWEFFNDRELKDRLVVDHD